jgi:hypothetical protein
VGVVAGEGPASRMCQLLGRPGGERRLRGTGGGELEPVGVRLLEMVAEDLVELRK